MLRLGHVLRRATTPRGLQSLNLFSKTRLLPSYSISIEANAVPFAAQFNAIVSGRPAPACGKPSRPSGCRIQRSSFSLPYRRILGASSFSSPVFVLRPADQRNSSCVLVSGADEAILDFEHA